MAKEFTVTYSKALRGPESRVRGYLYGRPWAMDPWKLAAVADAIERWATGEVTMSDAQLDERSARAESARGPMTAGEGIAVLPVHGVIAHRARSVQGMSTGAGVSTEILSGQLRGLVADPTISAIVLDIDSPGGDAAGLQELTAEMREMRGEKPIISFVNATAASAAYWIAAGASEIVATPSGLIGSIGVYMLHEDHSAELESSGVTVTMISAGEHKVEASPFAPLEGDARAHLQTLVDERYRAFTSDVGKGRKTSAKNVVANYGGGRVLPATTALEVGMIDRIGTLHDAVQRASELSKRRRRRRAADTSFSQLKETVNAASGGE